MSEFSRRNIFKGLIAGTALTSIDTTPKELQAKTIKGKKNNHAIGIEGQRKADLGNGYYLNPIISGDHPDPTILKDGKDYYMTFSSFFSYPGIVIWHSTDLINWSPLKAVLNKPLGTIWALDLCKHNNKYYIYIPANPDDKEWKIFVIWADNINGPWSEPIDLNISGCIDPGHIVGEDGKRYLFVNGIRKIMLSDDGLSTIGEITTAYQPWRYPENWITENFAPEGPKLLKYKGYFYIITAVGGTAGPVTGHMVIAARSKSINGPWEHCPYNPIVRTLSDEEPWWSKGHATIIEGPLGDWWMVYHGYENGFRTLGRQTLLEPMIWSKDGWPIAKGGDLSKPLTAPKGGIKSKNGFALSDDFSTNKFGIQWSFHAPSKNEATRVKYENNSIILNASGTSPANSSPIACQVGDQKYKAEVSLELLDDNTEAGFLLFYNNKAYVGLSFDQNSIKIHQYAQEHSWARINNVSKKLKIRIINDKNVITYQYSIGDNDNFITHGTRMEVSGINHNVFGDFLSLKLGIVALGTGEVRIKDFKYSAF